MILLQLATVSKLLREGDVPVRLTPEPTNEVDARAIAFQCQIDKKWKRIGYVVKEALDSVHLAMEEQKIVRVKFAWAKYISNMDTLKTRLLCWNRYQH